MARLQQVKTPRRGASKIADVTADILEQLEAGSLESATLSEGLAIDFGNLIASQFPDLEEIARDQIDPKAGITKRMAAAAKLLMATKGDTITDTLVKHPSDTIRGWGAYAIALQNGSSFQEKFEQLKPLADDLHFGVREWAWLAIRPDIVKSPIEAISILEPWAGSQSKYIRRFACEAIRPRGVWSAHIAQLKKEPQLALNILEPLKSDAERYVQDSVANWLNDAFKSQPEWVEQLCETWIGQSDTQATAYTVKRGLRSKKK